MSVSAPTPKRVATYADLLAVPDHLVAEILDGELVVSPRPALLHANASSFIGADLLGGFGHGPGGGAGSPGGWWILDEPELHFGQHVLVPDLAGWRRERMPKIPNVAFVELVPDWCCEVLSPSTARHDRLQKMRIYAREGVRHLWLVDPLARTLEVFRLEGERWLLLATHADDERVRAEPFEAAQLEIARWWIEL